MDHGLVFLQDLAIVMLTAGVVTVIFHRLKQPVILGYMLAGLIIGPHTPPFPLVQDKEVIKTLAELGMILLMFRMGLHFSLGKLFKIGATAFLAALFEISLMMFLGYQIGQAFAWSQMDSIFTGAMLAISSTTIIVKTLTDFKLLNQKFSDIIFGILIGEDLLAIAIIAVLPTLALSGTLPVQEVVQVSLKLAEFLAVVLIAGLLIVPKLLSYVAKFKEREMLLITTLGLCFGVALLAAKMGYSVALGAFLIGAIVAETRHAGQIEHLIGPVRDMFSAVFFVAVGMLIQPELLIEHALPAIMIAAVVIFGKIFSCSAAALLSGNDLRTSLKVGMGLAQIGEFSFIIAQLGISLKVTSDFLYPIVVSVSALTAFTTPYLLQQSDNLANFLEKIAPKSVRKSLSIYLLWINGLKSSTSLGKNTIVAKKIFLQLLLNILLIAAIFVGALSLKVWAEPYLKISEKWLGGTRGLFWFIAMILSLPLTISSIKKIRRVSDVLTQRLLIKSREQHRAKILPLVRHIFLLPALMLFLLVVLSFSFALLPPLPVFLGMLGIVVIIGLLLKKTFYKIYASVQTSLLELLSDTTTEYFDNESKAAKPIQLKGAEICTVQVGSDSPAIGKLIRELHIRSMSGANVVGIERDGTNIINPGPDEEFKAGDLVLLLGHESQLALAKRMFLKQ